MTTAAAAAVGSPRSSPPPASSSLLAASARRGIAGPTKHCGYPFSCRLHYHSSDETRHPLLSLRAPPRPLRLSSSSSSSHRGTGRWGKPLEAPIISSPPPPLPLPLPLRLCRCAGSSTESNSTGGGGGGVTQGLLVRVGEVLSMAFPVWVAAAALLGLLRPSSFLWVHQKWQIIGLTLTMLGMGMTLTLDDLRGAMFMPKELLTGFVLQYTVMPLSGFIVSKLLKLPSYYAAGLILVACCPGGTASNIVTYLARGNVALSVLMTAASTISAVVMTPFLTSKLAGQFVAVDPVGLFTSTFQVVLTPVLLGAILNQYCNPLVKLVSPLMPLIAVATVAILCGSAIAQNASAILASGFQVLLAVCCLHASGFFFGYTFSRMFRLDESSSRTISVEVGMQNSVLGVVLAGQHFGNPLTAVPCAVSSICHSIYGSILAGVWRSMPPKI